MDGPEIPILETARLRLRGIRGSDIDDYAALHADPEVTRYLLGSETWDRGRSWRHMAFAVGHWQLEGTGIWVAEEKASGEFVGVMGFWEPENWPGFELSYHLARRHWGKGYATEGAKAALAHAFLVWQREHVISLINPKNLPSIRVAERIGERLEARIEHFGRQYLLYGLDRPTYLTEVAPQASLALRAG
jgi:RimJ/RimL family protein N-acetyltransferase